MRAQHYETLRQVGPRHMDAVELGRIEDLSGCFTSIRAPSETSDKANPMSAMSPAVEGWYEPELEASIPPIDNSRRVANTAAVPCGMCLQRRAQSG